MDGADEQGCGTNDSAIRMIVYSGFPLDFLT